MVYQMRIGTTFEDDEAERRRKMREALDQPSAPNMRLGAINVGGETMRPQPGSMFQHIAARPIARPPTPEILGGQSALDRAKQSWADFNSASNAAAARMGINVIPQTPAGRMAPIGGSGVSEYRGNGVSAAASQNVAIQQPESRTLQENAALRYGMTDEVLERASRNAMISGAARRGAAQTLQERARGRAREQTNLAAVDMARYQGQGDIAKAMAIGQAATINAQSREKVAVTGADAKRDVAETNAQTSANRLETEMDDRRADRELKERMMKEGITAKQAQDEFIMRMKANIEESKQNHMDERAKKDQALLDMMLLKFGPGTAAAPGSAPVAAPAATATVPAPAAAPAPAQAAAPTPAAAAPTATEGTFYSAAAKRNYKRNQDGTITWL